MDELHSLDPRRQELLEARFTGVVSGSTGSTGSCSVGAKVRRNMDTPFQTGTTVFSSKHIKGNLTVKDERKMPMLTVYLESYSPQHPVEFILHAVGPSWSLCFC